LFVFESNQINNASYIYKGEWAAVAIARTIAMNQKSEVLIHGVNGKIRAEDSYENDPFPPKG
jgi:hypothetical protein